MGLDMYLEKYPRYKNVTPEQACCLSEYINWKNDSEAQKYSFEDWTGYDKANVPLDAIDFYKDKTETKYWAWDEAKKYPHQSFVTSLIYWRKAYPIHDWFVINTQYGEDNCRAYEVTLEDLNKLLELCKSNYFDTGYDDWTEEKIKDTIPQLQQVIRETDFENEVVFYQASW